MLEAGVNARLVALEARLIELEAELAKPKLDDEQLALWAGAAASARAERPPLA